MKKWHILRKQGIFGWKGVGAGSDVYVSSKPRFLCSEEVPLVSLQFFQNRTINVFRLTSMGIVNIAGM